MKCLKHPNEDRPIGCRAPCGARGLKSAEDLEKKYLEDGRAPCGARGLKSEVLYLVPDGRGRAPCGARGLKYRITTAAYIALLSRPVRGAWIEIETEDS